MERTARRTLVLVQDHADTAVITGDAVSLVINEALAGVELASGLSIDQELRSC